ncbi:hypothetical protein FSP39_012985 [Pinctada imbricata]|uniref:KH homology domain-containing protein 4 n=1 Tax=Pinctada imbricata TaxID=66713 RepID=A0AA88YAP3_PINIB|nr:hypothetical protein FSP39_012985 [Pinctada imbricata]
MLIAKGKLKPSQLSQQTQGNKAKNQAPGQSLIVAEVEINDVPIGCRNMLTRGATQEEISKMSGAAVSTRGRYVSFEEKSKGIVSDRPLYLCVQGPTQQSVDIAVGRINEIIINGMKSKGSRFSGQARQPPPPQPPTNIHVPRPNFSQPPPLMSINTQPQGLSIVQEKLYIGLEHAPPSFDVKSKMLGPMGSFLSHIQTETGAKVTLRGKGSGFIEPQSGREAFEPMHVHIQHPSLMGLQQAKQLSENLIQTVQQEYAQFQQALAAMPPTLPPGTAALLAGIQQSAPASLQLNPPGLALPASQPGFPPLTPGIQGLTSIGGLPGLSPPQMPQVILPTSSAPASLPPNLNSIPGSAPQLLVPSSLTSTSFAATLGQVQAVNSMPGPAGALGPQQQPMLIQTQLPPPGPPPQIPPLQAVTPGPPQLVHQSVSMAPTASSPLPQPLVTSVQPELQLVSQSPVIPGWGGQAVQPAPQQQIVQQIPGSSGPPISMVTSSPVYVSTTTASSYTYPGPPKEEPKRRFTEEKQEDKVPENLLGYEHGPPHLTNLVVQGPPPPQSQSLPSSVAQSQGQYHLPPMESVPPPGVHSYGLVTASQPSPVYVHTSVSDEGRVTHTYAVQPSAGVPPQAPPQHLTTAQPYGGAPLHPVLEQRQTESPDHDKKLMPPPALPTSLKRPSSGDRTTDRKKLKNALSSVSEYGDDDEEAQSVIMTQQRDLKKYQYNQYSNTPQMYGQAPEPQLVVSAPQQFVPVSSPHPFPQELAPPPGAYDQPPPPPPQQAQPPQFQNVTFTTVQGHMQYQAPQANGQPPPPETFQQGAPLQGVPIQGTSIALAPQDIQQHPDGTPTLTQHMAPPPATPPTSQAPPSQHYQQLYGTAPPQSPPPPASQPPWVTEPPPPALPTAVVDNTNPQYTTDSPHQGTPQEEPRLMSEPPPPPPNFQPPQMPGTPQQMLVPPPPPPPPQPLVGGQPQYGGQIPQFAAPPPNFHAPPPGAPYW